jgi:hypothetical protein
VSPSSTFSTCAKDVQNSTETLDTQIAYAENATLALSPGQGFPVETLSPTSSTPSPTSTPTSTSTAKVTPTAVPSSQPPLSPGAIAGIAIGGTAVLLFASALIYFCGRQRTVKEIMQTQGLQGPPSYQPGTGHMSLASSPGYPAKLSPVGVDPLRIRRYSNQGGMYDRSAAETESYRSRSPPMDESRDSTMPHMNYPGSAGTTSPARVESPLMRRPVPGSPISLGSPGRPIRPSQSNPISPLEETIYQPLAADIPPPTRYVVFLQGCKGLLTLARFHQVPLQTGPTSFLWTAIEGTCLINSEHSGKGDMV